MIFCEGVHGSGWLLQAGGNEGAKSDANTTNLVRGGISNLENRYHALHRHPLLSIFPLANLRQLPKLIL